MYEDDVPSAPLNQQWALVSTSLQDEVAMFIEKFAKGPLSNMLAKEGRGLPTLVRVLDYIDIELDTKVSMLALDESISSLVSQLWELLLL